MKKRAKILVAEDDPRARDALGAMLKDEGYDVEIASGGLEASELLRESEFDAALLDVRMPGRDGLALLREVRQRPAAPAVLVMTAYGSSAVAIEAMKLGAYDYLIKPLHFDEVLIQIERAIASRRQSMELEAYRHEVDGAGEADLVGESPAMQRLYKLIGQVAPADSTVLIRGESGTGKELIARAIHAHSHRSSRRMVSVHCAAIPETLLEAELFGYEKGAFTGAVARRKGWFQAADGGTIFLDEVGELPPATQSKLLRVLQERTIEPLGAGQTLSLDVRILAATNRDLEDLVRKGTFREDLFYRLNVVAIVAPALRERREDIPSLGAHLLKKLVARRKLPTTTLSPAALDALKARDWPGNVRELEHAIERAAILSHGAPIGPELVAGLPPAQFSDPFERVTLDEGLHGSVARLERYLIGRALAQAGGNRTRAAEILKINRRLLYDKLREFGME
ncbi:MAG: sigma-54-dependent transcriptional regulator [Bryobacteraceae bacterium]